MQVNFSDDFRHVSILAQEEARRLGHREMEVGHLLLALCRMGDSAAANALQRLGCDLAKLRRSIEHTFDRIGPSVQSDSGLPVSKEAEPVLREIYLEALDYGREVDASTELWMRIEAHEEPIHITTKHLLLSLLRDESRRVSELLWRDWGINHERLKAGQ